MLVAHVDPESEAIKRLDVLLEKLRNALPQRVLPSLSAHLARRAERAILGEQEPDGTPFEALAPSYASWRRRKGYTIGGKVTMLRMGAAYRGRSPNQLFRSLRPGASMNISTLDTKRSGGVVEHVLTYGTSDPVGALMQKDPVPGGPISELSGVPARPFLYMTDSDCDFAVNLVMGMLEEEA